MVRKLFKIGEVIRGKFPPAFSTFLMKNTIYSRPSEDWGFAGCPNVDSLLPNENVAFWPTNVDCSIEGC